MLSACSSCTRRRAPELIGALALVAGWCLCCCGWAADTSPLHWWLEAERFGGVLPLPQAQEAAAWRIDSAATLRARLAGGASGQSVAALPAALADPAPATAEIHTPRSGQYRLWVRYADWRRRAEPFRVRLRQGRSTQEFRFGERPVADPFSGQMMQHGVEMVWAGQTVQLREGLLTVELLAPDAAEADRLVDVVLFTDDAAFEPRGTARPTGAAQRYLESVRMRGLSSAPWVVSTAHGLMPEHWQSAAEPRISIVSSDETLPQSSLLSVFDIAAQGDAPFTVSIMPHTSELPLRLAAARGAARQRRADWAAVLTGLCAELSPALEAPPACLWLQRTLLACVHAGASQVQVVCDSQHWQRDCYGAIVEQAAALLGARRGALPHVPAAVLLSGQAHLERGLSPTALGVDALLNVLCAPRTADGETFTAAMFGDVFDILVPIPGRSPVLQDYAVIFLAGDGGLDRVWLAELKAAVETGATLIVNAAHAEAFDAAFLGFTAQRGTLRADRLHSKPPEEFPPAEPFSVQKVRLTTGEALATTVGGLPVVVRNLVGNGQVIAVLVPHGLAADGSASLPLAYAVAHVASRLSPVEVRGPVQYHVSHTAATWRVLMLNLAGVAQRPDGTLFYDRAAAARVEIVWPGPVLRAHEQLTGRAVAFEFENGCSSATISVPPAGAAVLEIEPAGERFARETPETSAR